MIKIKLISSEDSSDNEKIIELVRNKIHYNQISSDLENNEEIENEKIKDAYIKSLEKKSEKVNFY
ncbi:hypothetical protein [Clostridium folliculivorans]|nr:hypothetical protein [Clostridium folliculivorans]